MIDEALPIEGAWVCRREAPDDIGAVLGIVPGPSGPALEVDFGPVGRRRLRPGEWGCGLRPGFVVQDVPRSAVRRTLGTGTVIETRALADREQALVQLHGDGRTVWLPFEQLRRIKDPALRHRRAEPQTTDAAERTALTMMAYGLRSWNEATGALDRLDVDPLPHQIGLVHRILSSGDTNWLIADDVGLGKTIEVGLLLAGLERSRGLRRVLIVVPSGLTRQWKDEMRDKFGRDFRIYGVDFRVSDPREWFDMVIVSLDLAKPRGAKDTGEDLETSFGKLLAAGTWDLVIFDEAHRLSRDEAGRSTLRYRLAQALRTRTDAMILLSGTPHQGDSGRFVNLLSLVRPRLAPALSRLDENPQIVGEIVLRNRKIDVVDLDGNFIFQGLVVRRVEIETTEAVQALERALRTYLRRGYGAAEAMAGKRGRAVGFVMTIYRKLASSSVAALFGALRRRQSRLAGLPAPDTGTWDGEDENQGDLDAGDGLDDLASHGFLGVATEFFEDESNALADLIRRCEACLPEDPKGRAVRAVLREAVRGAGEKVLIFTEYRDTQAYLKLLVEAELGTAPALIHGGQTADEKRAAIANFEAAADVLISTEAGGEGLNIQRACHILVNYDLPWNPARIAQRIGRLYRYGQAKRVVVMNFHGRDTIDNEIVSTLMDRLQVIVRQMSTVGSEYDERYASEVMGDLLERVDVTSLIEEARSGQVERSQERVDAALEQARRAKTIEDDILRDASAFDPHALQRLGSFTTRHVAQFVARAAPMFGIEVIPIAGDLERFTLRLPSELRGVFPEFSGRTVVLATTRRSSRDRDAAATPVDFKSTFLRYLVERVIAPEFGGTYGVYARDRLPVSTVMAYVARFQNDQGDPQGEELIVLSRSAEGGFEVDNRAVADMFVAPLPSAMPMQASALDRRAIFDAGWDRAEATMIGSATAFRHPNSLVALAIAEAGSA